MLSGIAKNGYSTHSLVKFSTHLYASLMLSENGTLALNDLNAVVPYFREWCGELYENNDISKNKLFTIYYQIIFTNSQLRWDLTELTTTIH